jgi:hypothetical protein
MEAIIMSVQEQLDKLKEVEALCQAFIRQSEKNLPSIKEYREGMSQAGKMVLEIINRKGPLL